MSTPVAPLAITSQTPLCEWRRSSTTSAASTTTQATAPTITAAATTMPPANPAAIASARPMTASQKAMFHGLESARRRDRFAGAPGGIAPRRAAQKKQGEDEEQERAHGRKNESCCGRSKEHARAQHDEKRPERIARRGAEAHRASGPKSPRQATANDLGIDRPRRPRHRPAEDDTIAC